MGSTVAAALREDLAEHAHERWQWLSAEVLRPLLIRQRWHDIVAAADEPEVVLESALWVQAPTRPRPLTVDDVMARHDDMLELRPRAPPTRRRRLFCRCPPGPSGGEASRDGEAPPAHP